MQFVALPIYAMQPQQQKPQSETSVKLDLQVSGRDKDQLSVADSHAEPNDQVELSDQEIQQFLCNFTEQKSQELGWSEAWRWWREVYHTPGLRQIIRDYVFESDEEDTSLQWTDEGRYCYVIKQMSPVWRARLVQPQVLKLLTADTLNERLLNDELAVLLLLAERVRQEPAFKQRLFAFIEQSKHNPQMATAAANAMTVLNMAGVCFSYKDFRG
ncbi:MAG: hypothetical protein AAF310_04080, partial [Myxococcota bacterium]